MQRRKRCGFDPWVRKIPWSRKWKPLQYSCLENSTNRGAWWATVHGVTRNRTQLSPHKAVTVAETSTSGGLSSVERPGLFSSPAFPAQWKTRYALCPVQNPTSFPSLTTIQVMKWHFSQSCVLKLGCCILLNKTVSTSQLQKKTNYVLIITDELKTK